MRVRRAQTAVTTTASCFDQPRHHCKIKIDSFHCAAIKLYSTNATFLLFARGSMQLTKSGPGPLPTTPPSVTVKGQEDCTHTRADRFCHMNGRNRNEPLTYWTEWMEHSASGTSAGWTLSSVKRPSSRYPSEVGSG